MYDKKFTFLLFTSIINLKRAFSKQRQCLLLRHSISASTMMGKSSVIIYNSRFKGDILCAAGLKENLKQTVLRLFRFILFVCMRL